MDRIEPPMTLIFTLRAPDPEFYDREIVKNVLEIVARTLTNQIRIDRGKIEILGTESSMAKTRADYARLALLNQGASEQNAS